jgi:hypothetical protein
MSFCDYFKHELLTWPKVVTLERLVFADRKSFEYLLTRTSSNQLRLIQLVLRIHWGKKSTHAADC